MHYDDYTEKCEENPFGFYNLGDYVYTSRRDLEGVLGRDVSDPEYQRAFDPTYSNDEANEFDGIYTLENGKTLYSCNIT